MTDRQWTRIPPPASHRHGYMPPPLNVGDVLRHIAVELGRIAPEAISVEELTRHCHRMGEYGGALNGVFSEHDFDRLLSPKYGGFATRQEAAEYKVERALQALLTLRRDRFTGEDILDPNPKIEQTEDGKWRLADGVTFDDLRAREQPLVRPVPS